MEKSFLYSILFILFLLFFVNISCSTDPECISSVGFAIVDSNYNNLVDRQGNRFILDTVKIFNQKGIEISPLHSGYTTDLYKGKPIGWVFSIGLLDGKQRSNIENYMFDRKYYLYLNKNNIDTIQIIGLGGWCSQVTVKFNSKTYIQQGSSFYLFNKK